MNKELVELQEILNHVVNWEEKLANLLDVDVAHVHALFREEKQGSKHEQAIIKTLLKNIQMRMSLGEHVTDILFQEQLQHSARRVHVEQRTAFLEALEYLVLCFKDDKKKNDE